MERCACVRLCLCCMAVAGREREADSAGEAAAAEEECRKSNAIESQPESLTVREEARRRRK